jgi:Na+/melibiose symporter-like transporter
VEADRESEKDLFAYHMKRLDNNDAQNKREHKFASRFIWACLGVSVAFSCLLIFLAFFGAPTQQVTALLVLNTMLKLASGAGLFVLVRQVWRRLFKKPADDE